MRKPKIILLDEPVNSLDLQKQLELCQLLQKIVDTQNVDIIVVLHDINLAARYARHIAVMDENGSLYSSASRVKSLLCVCWKKCMAWSRM